MFKKILLIDDEPAILEICCDYLKASGYDVVTAKDGLQGLSAALREKPDLIVLDLILPKMDGLGVCREIRSLLQGTCLSASASGVSEIGELRTICDLDAFRSGTVERLFAKPVRTLSRDLVP